MVVTNSSTTGSPQTVPTTTAAGSSSGTSKDELLFRESAASDFFSAFGTGGGGDDDDGSQSGHDDPAHKAAAAHQLERQYVTDIVRREGRLVRVWRRNVLVSLVLVAALAVSATYWYLAQQEQEGFETGVCVVCCSLSLSLSLWLHDNPLFSSNFFVVTITRYDDVPISECMCISV